MPYQYRKPRDYFFTTLDAAATISATSLSSPDFASLSSSYTTGSYLPLVLHDPALKVFEVVWVVGHGAGATTVTVERGKEGSTARAWGSGTQILSAPSIRDSLGYGSRASLPTDPYVGERRVLDDEGAVVESTFSSGWQASVGIATPANFGLRQAGTAIPASGVVIMRGGQVTANTDASGQIQVTYTSPFPNQTLHSVVSWMFGGVAPFFSVGVLSGSHTASGFKAYLFRGDTGGTAGIGVSVTFSYLAAGY